MRLTAIKLAGFKSFVDSTTFSAPTNLTGIVGPNGCGKSNIIDAVRWVMGEGSAKVLRGESMADVIFSGSSSRKPVGTATVELMFDNSDGQIAGEFAAYSEISVKRQVGRDGISHYLLNGSRCRRKDVRDLFLGTGLGSKSYSIIEQGMISQIVDAGPDDIRSHLEEAAGISRYKERRKETERRIAHTCENLERLADLRQEIASHLGRLKRQANAAVRYRKLKIEQRELESRLLTLQWAALQKDADIGRAGLTVQETARQERLAEQRAIELRMEKLHEQQAKDSKAFNQVQGELYSVGSDIARLEQSIEHSREMWARQQKEFEETSSALQDMEQHMALDRTQVEDLTLRLAGIEPKLEQTTLEESVADTATQVADDEVQSWQESLQTHRLEGNELNRKADSLRATIEMLDDRTQAGTTRLESLAGETEGADTSALSQEVVTLTARVKVMASELTDQQKLLDSKHIELDDRRHSLRKSTLKQHEIQGKINRCEGRLESLKALQQVAREDGGEVTWLASNKLASAPRLLERLEVHSGWEAAVETVLGFWLDAVLVEDSAALSAGLGELTRDEDGGVELTLLGRQSTAIKVVSGSLAEKVVGPDLIIEQLNRVQTAESLEEARTAIDGLGSHASVITAAGQWLGTGWARVAGSLSGQAGKLGRKQEIASLQEDATELREQWSALRKSNQSGAETLPAMEQAIVKLQQGVNALHRSGAELHSRLTAGRARIDDLDVRQKQIAEEVAALQQQRNTDQSQIKASRGELAGVLDEMAGVDKQRTVLEKQRRSLLASRDKARGHAREVRNQRHELALKAESRRASLESLRQSLQRMDSQFAQLQQRYQDLGSLLAQKEDPKETHQAAMDSLLQKRIEVEQQLRIARGKLQQLEEDYRQLDADRQTCVGAVEAIRESLERARLQQQEVELNARSLQRLVEKMDQDVVELAKSLPDDAKSEDWQEDLEKLALRISRLEPVNLAAITEYEEGLKRKQYMDTQNADLESALETLESAIKKIDRKTRTRFKDTFEGVNQGIQELFPRLFGGGHAYLELTGEDLLTTGVTIMARPPGKRVSSIHLLSGGEKALTAVAFVFAIFRLNLSPFCLLDEVDAPLDEANVARFTALVKEMAETVQFIIVTHNKITMEATHQLSGVTMQEAGVSRLVQVDIDAATRMVSD